MPIDAHIDSHTRCSATNIACSKLFVLVSLPGEIFCCTGSPFSADKPPFLQVIKVEVLDDLNLDSDGRL